MVLYDNVNVGTPSTSHQVYLLGRYLSVETRVDSLEMEEYIVIFRVRGKAKEGESRLLATPGSPYKTGRRKTTDTIPPPVIQSVHVFPRTQNQYQNTA